ncbi:MAG: hypothetical protein LKM32_09320 [Chiayiivirga sp.]|jgi:hypothetical protein|uniref:hypothetical protein n=1 Tax=Chiayiivirga sp. TaxID=2041042 RepID=UPI0025C289F3|nr:hypothetical protein [Chiayiivirga sp.]MCI1729554.1 hypothetical protein [Chiayiivirga sp.]
MTARLLQFPRPSKIPPHRRTTAQLRTGCTASLNVLARDVAEWPGRTPTLEQVDEVGAFVAGVLMPELAELRRRLELATGGFDAS